MFNSIVGIAELVQWLSYRVNDCGVVIGFPTGARDFSPPKHSDWLGPTQPYIQWILEALFPGIKQLGHVVDHLCAEHRVEIYLHSPILLNGCAWWQLCLYPSPVRNVWLWFFCNYISQFHYIMLHKVLILWNRVSLSIPRYLLLSNKIPCPLWGIYIFVQ